MLPNLPALAGPLHQNAKIVREASGDDMDRDVAPRRRRPRVRFKRIGAGATSYRLPTRRLRGIHRRRGQRGLEPLKKLQRDAGGSGRFGEC